MEFNFSVRAVTSALLAAAAVFASGQTFGRFGYAAPSSFHGFQLDRAGITATHPIADQLGFLLPATEWRPTETDEFGQTVNLGTPRFGTPSRLRLSLLAPGLAYYFPQGMRWKLRSTSAPYLTWGEGSGSAKVPTPAVRMVVMSFRDGQPAIVFGFPDRPTSLVVVGRPGAWEVRADGFRGWVRLGLPQGLRPEAANSAATLGRLAEVAKSTSAFWTRPEPRLVSFRAEADSAGQSVVGTWTFDEPFFLIPSALTLAPLAGYRVNIVSRHARLVADLGLGDGPHDVSTTETLRVQFPVQRIPLGRALAIGTPGEAIGTVSPFDVASIAQLAFENLLAGRDGQTRRAAEEAVASFLAQASYVKEPFSNQLLPFDAAGQGIDLAAAHALLQQALIGNNRPSSETNALLTSVAWRRDWDTCLPWVHDADTRRRTAALAAVASALCPEPNRRVAAGMLQAGLAAEQGMRKWRERENSVTSSPLLEPMLALRAALFQVGAAGTYAHPFVDTLMSPVRIFGEEAVTVGAPSTGAYPIEWSVLEPKAGMLTLACGYPFDVAPKLNLPRFGLDRLLGLGEIRYTPEVGGTCQALLRLSSWAPPLPKLAPTPLYDEARR